jgi:hypothetical protein
MDRAQASYNFYWKDPTDDALSSPEIRQLWASRPGVERFDSSPLKPPGLPIPLHLKTIEDLKNFPSRRTLLSPDSPDLLGLPFVLGDNNSVESFSDITDSDGYSSVESQSPTLSFHEAAPVSPVLSYLNPLALPFIPASTECVF